MPPQVLAGGPGRTPRLHGTPGVSPDENRTSSADQAPNLGNYLFARNRLDLAGTKLVSATHCLCRPQSLNRIGFAKVQALHDSIRNFMVAKRFSFFFAQGLT